MKTRKTTCRAAALTGILISLSLISGCSSSSANSVNNTTSGDSVQTASTANVTTSTTATTTITAKASPAHHKVDKLGLFMPDKTAGTRQLTKAFSGPWTAGKDIASFEAFATQEISISGSNFKSVWESYWNQYSGGGDCKIGYYLTFTLTSGKQISKTIKGFEDTNDFREYLEIYLYDDVHQIQGNWYSHLTTADTTPQTVCTSIKLTAGNKISEISTINLTTFIYNSPSDFDVSGNYTGIDSYTIPISRGN